ncbi:hypothetical protein ACE02P_17830 [Shewanella bicestrii]
MGAAAYNRGSIVIGLQIESDFRLSNSATHERRQRLERIEQQINEIEQFCLDAQSLLVDITDENHAKGLLRSHMHRRWLKHHKTLAYRHLDHEHLQAHIDWVHSDRMSSISHLVVCVRKAKAIMNKLNKLNVAYLLPFNVPNHITT